MKILLTGATGFLGSHLLKRFLSSGYEVTILKRSFSNTRRIDEYLHQVRTYDIDHSHLEQPFKDNGKYDALVHTATLYGRKNESVCEIFKANTEFPLQLLETAVLYNTDTYLNTDTILYKYLNTYALSKKQFMEWGKQFASMGKIRFVNIKLEHMYGPGDDASKFTTYVIKSCLANLPELRLTPGDQKRDFIYIDDVVSAYQMLLKKTTDIQDVFQEYELGSGHPVSIRSFVETVHKLTKSKTYLNFGALPYRNGEIMESCANIEGLTRLDWKASIDLISGLKYIIRKEATV